MAKNNPKLDLPDIAVTPSEETKKNSANKKSPTKKSGNKKRRSPIAYFRNIISELKKVTWASFKKSKDNSGVIGQTGVVLLVTLFFMVVIALFDTGLLQLLRLLVEAGA